MVIPNATIIELSLTFTWCTGGKIFPEEELTHLDGHKGSKPVRIGNGAIDHVQLVRLYFCHEADLVYLNFDIL